MNLEKGIRRKTRPHPEYNKSLPIYEKKDEIIRAIKKHPVLIISGETGSGKTTQIPKFCLDAGRGINGKVGCTQPRRIAAITVSARIAEELDDQAGELVGYKIRFTDKIRRNAFIKIMTDGILLAEAQKDPLLYQYDTIIVDEAHERSLNIDFILGMLKTLSAKRKDLKIIITSATIDTEKFSKSFGNAPVIEVSGRMYPVEVKYFKTEKDDEETDESSYVEKASEAVDYLQRTHPYGDILIFMPTEQDIIETSELIEGKKYRDVTVLPLFSKLSGADQARVFLKIAGRKIIIATNIAETSITIPGIKYVIDSGLARIPRYSPATRTTSLPVMQISKSSADQRKGRCGRVENGVCIRLYSENDYLLMPTYTPPEILRANLAEVILKMIALNLGDISVFPFIDSPPQKSISDGFNLLTELGAIFQGHPKKNKKENKRYFLTAKGRMMSKIPADPRLSCMLIEAQKRGCLEEVLIIASALSIADPREKAPENQKAVDEAHSAFKNPDSDFITLLNIWNKYHDAWQQVKSNNQMRKFCREKFLSYKRMREWRDIYFQLSDILEEAGFAPVEMKCRDIKEQKEPLYSAVHKSILSGFLSNIGFKKEKNIYKFTKGREVMIFPGSSLFNRPPQWVAAAEVVETTRVYARTVASISGGWIEGLAKNLCSYSYKNPFWHRERGEVVASEQVSLFGLVIVENRLASYGKIAPDKASDIFIQSALVEGDIEDRDDFSFLIYNQRLIDDVRNIENKLRKRDILITDADIFSFYKKRLSNCFDIRSLKSLIREKKDDGFLRMKKSGLFQYEPDPDELALYPDLIRLGKENIECEYDFNPGDEKDGVTIKVPSVKASIVETKNLDWLVPGMLKEKITALIRALPKSYRKQLVPVADTVNIIISEMPRNKTSLITTLGEFIYRRFSVDIPASAWSERLLADYLKMRISITDIKGRELASSRDKAILTRPLIENKEDKNFESIRRKWEKTGITYPDVPDVPEAISFETDDGLTRTLFPGLKISDGYLKNPPYKVDLRLFIRQKQAENSHKNAIAALYESLFIKDLKFLKKNLSLPLTFKDKVKYFGGQKAVEQGLYDEAIRQLFFKNIRTRADFENHANKTGPVILLKAREILDDVTPVFYAFNDAKTKLRRFKLENILNPFAVKLIDELELQMEMIVPKDFYKDYDATRLVHVGRYLEAILIRAERALINFEKDQAKSREVKIYKDKMEELIKNVSDETSEAKKNALYELYWLIEEYKVSLFAQELKTNVKVSNKILEEKIKEIRRMM